MAVNYNTLSGLFKESYADKLEDLFSSMFMHYTETEDKIVVSYSPIYIFKARESKVIDLIEWVK